MRKLVVGFLFRRAASPRTGDGGPDACAPGVRGRSRDSMVCPDPRHVCGGLWRGRGRCLQNARRRRHLRRRHGVHGEHGGGRSDEGGVITCACADGYTGDRCESRGRLSGMSTDAATRIRDPARAPTPTDTRTIVDGSAVRAATPARTRKAARLSRTRCARPTRAAVAHVQREHRRSICARDPSFGGRFCESCADGYRRRNGRLTTDACLPDPCAEPPFTRCVASELGTSCEC
jgi:hypothetical protein